MTARYMLASSGIGRRELDLVLAGELVETQAIRAAQKWTTTTTWCLLLTGPPGTGKTIAAVDVVVRAAQRYEVRHAGIMPCSGLPFRFVRAPALGRIMAADTMDSICTCQALVIDDLGTEHIGASGLALSAVEEIITVRESEKKRTIITSNLSVADIGARYGARVRRRIADHGTVYWLGNEESTR